MKTLLICPNQAIGLAELADSRPVTTLPILGEAFISHWMHHLAGEGIKEVRIVTGDEARAIKEYTGDGSRWGLQVEVFHEMMDLTMAEARKRYRPSSEEGWAPEPSDVIVADHLPGIPEHKLFNSYEGWFSALLKWMPFVIQSKRIGLREIQPGVWAGRRTKISPEAKLVGPCWIGDNVRVGKNAVIGPNAFLEEQVVVDPAGAIQNSWVGPNTFIGTLTEVKDSLAWGDLLINWKTGSHTLVPDAFLMTSLSEKKEREERPARRSAAAPAQNPAARPFGAIISFAQKLQS